MLYYRAQPVGAEVREGGGDVSGREEAAITNGLILGN